MIYYSTFNVPGLRRTFLIAKKESRICSIFLSNYRKEFVDILKKQFNDRIVFSSDKLMYEIKQLQDYFKGKRKDFNIKLSLNGTDFQMKVWRAISCIKYGKTKSYSDIAKKIKKSKSSRAVGSACRNNPLPIVIPCHRVIGKDGTLRGFGGGLKLKRELLKLEQGNM